MEPVKLAIIGGSGVYRLEKLKITGEHEIMTPFGKPSDKILIGEIGGNRVAFLARHGEGHLIMPSEINNCANIWAMKSLGVRRIISISAVGSLKEEIRPGDFVLPDQLFDRTKGRVSTFFGNGAVAHVSFAEPYCSGLSELIHGHAANLGIRSSIGGTYVCIEGPQFSTKAESRFYRSTGADIIGMTNLPEAKLAREAELCYATIALVTDYDVWKDETVTVDKVLATLKANAENVNRLLESLLSDRGVFECADHACWHSLENAIMTAPDKIPHDTYRNLELLIGRYVKP
ncbi:MAG: S-methyl-5'-thioadenosine phosphorylase [Candidatus Wallbacteria bacterium]|nr:S-methyl-5'-thioadenosine phosphorylase [Candidatus Wallbacteria bacterium]